MQKTTKKIILTLSLVLAVFLILSQTALGERFNFPQNLTGKLFSFLGDNEITLKDYDKGYIILVKPKATGSGDTRAEAGDVVEIRKIEDLKKKFGNDKPFLGNKEKTKLLAFYYPGELTKEEKEKMTRPAYEDREAPNSKSQAPNKAQNTKGENPNDKAQMSNQAQSSNGENTKHNSQNPNKTQNTNGQTQRGEESHQLSVTGDQENNSRIANNQSPITDNLSEPDSGKKNENKPDEPENEPNITKNRAYGVDYTQILSEEDILIARDPDKGFEKLPTLNLDYLKKKQENQQAAAEFSPKIAKIEKTKEQIGKFLHTLIPQTLAASESESIVDPDNGDGTDYTSLNAWESGEERDLTASDEIAVATCRSTGGSADTTAVTIDGWTTSETNYIKVWTDPEEGYRHEGKWDDSAYRLVSTHSSSWGYGALTITNDSYATINGLQIYYTGSGGNAHGGITIDNGDSISEVEIKNSIIKSSNDLSGASAGIRIEPGSANLAKIYNNIIYDFTYNDYYITGVVSRLFSGDYLYCYNNTFYNNDRNLRNEGDADAFIIKNNLSLNGVNFDYYGSFDTSSDYNISSDGTAPGSNSITNANVKFANEDGDDFRLYKLDDTAKNAGTDLSSDPNLAFSEDIEGESRGFQGAWDIGADEAVYYPSKTNTPATNFMTDGLIGYWSFDGSAMDWSASGGEARDLSGNGYHGGAENITSANATAGRQGQGLSFNGSDEYVGVGSVTGEEFRKKITIQSSQVDADLTDFPVYVDLSTLGSDFFSKTNSGCADVRVTESDGSTEVPREIVSCDTTAETGEMHFKAPSVSASSDTDFYIYYGSGGSDYADSDTYGAENVWANGYTLVTHDGGGTDSTSNDHDGTGYGGVSIGGISGILGSATAFDGVDDYVEVPYVPGDTSQTYVAWINLDNVSTNDYWLFDTGDDTLGGIQVFAKDTGGWRFRIDDSESNGRATDANTSSVADTWVHVVVRIEKGNNMEMFFNGQADGEQIDISGYGDISGTLPQTLIGNFDGAHRNFNGKIDEVRIYNRAFSSGWISTEYNNQNSPGAFYNVGSEETTADPTKTKTISFWIKADDTTSRKVMDIDGADQIEIDASSNIAATGFPDPTVYVDGESSSATIDSDWRHVVITDSTGVEPTALDIGRAGSEYFEGALDQIRFYDSVISQDEAGKLYRHGKRTLQLNSSTKNTQTDGLVGHWTFDGPDIDWLNTGAEIRDVSGQENHGAVNNFGQQAATRGKQGQALSFDGVDDYIQITEGSILDDGPYTILAWVKTDYIDDKQAIFSSGPRPQLIHNNNGNNKILIHTPDGNVASQSTLLLDEWVFVSATVDSGGTGKIFINGHEDASGTAGGVDDSKNTRIGMDDNLVSYKQWHGQIDDVRVYNRALSESEIQKLYRMGNRKFQIRQ